MDEFFGLFGESGKAWAKAHRRCHEKAFADCEALLAECSRALHGKSVRDTKQLLVSLLFARCLEHFQAAVLLIEHGMEAAAKAVLRAQCEAMFTACAVSRDDSTAQAYLDDDLRQQQKLMNKAVNSSGPVLAVFRASAVAGRMAELREEIGRAGAKELRVEELARTAGLHDWYLSVYVMLSRAAHTQMRDLGRQAARRPDGSLEALTTGPSDDETGRLLAIAALALVNVRTGLGEVYAEDTQAFVETHEPVFRGMVREWMQTHPGYDEWGI
jgi:hypothetical protein